LITKTGCRGWFQYLLGEHRGNSYKQHGFMRLRNARYSTNPSEMCDTPQPRAQTGVSMPKAGETAT
jgi:hypothetical protein